MDRLTLEQAAHALPSKPQGELAELGFTPAMASFGRGPVLRLTDGDCIVAVLEDEGGAAVAFESVLADGTLLVTTPEDPNALPPLSGCDREVVDGPIDKRLARHRQRLRGEGVRLDADLIASLPGYGERLVRKPTAQGVGGIFLPAMLVFFTVMLGVLTLSVPVIAAALVVDLGVVLVWVYDVAEGELPGTSFLRWFGVSGRTAPAALRDQGRAFLGQAERRGVARTRSAELEALGFSQVDSGEGTRYRRGKARRYRRSTHVSDDGEVLVHLLERDGPRKWLTVIQSMHADVIVETVVGGGLYEPLVAHYRSESGPTELDAAVREHRRRIADRRVVPLHGKEQMVRGLGRMIEQARGEQAIHGAVRILQFVLVLLLMPYLVFTNLPEEVGIAAVAFLAWALQQLVRPELASLGMMFTGELPEVSPRVIEHIGREREEEEEKAKRFFGLL